jgi:hypothetical protein
MKIYSSWKMKDQNLSLRTVIDEIVQKADPEKILLLSASFEYQITENIFQKNPVEQSLGNRYELLILSEAQERNSSVKKEIELLQQLGNHKNIRFVVMDIAEFNKEVETGSLYWRYILLNAMLCYDKGTVPMAAPTIAI